MWCNFGVITNKLKAMKITLCDANQIGDIHTIDEVNKQCHDLIYAWLEPKEDNDNVFVFFFFWSDADMYKYEHSTFLISHRIDDIYEIVDSNIEGFADSDIMHINIFEFETYEEAFKYCIDLKEGL